MVRDSAGWSGVRLCVPASLISLRARAITPARKGVCHG
jgi:hypothetical protein